MGRRCRTRGRLFRCTRKKGVPTDPDLPAWKVSAAKWLAGFLRLAHSPFLLGGTAGFKAWSRQTRRSICTRPTRRVFVAHEQRLVEPNARGRLRPRHRQAAPRRDHVFLASRLGRWFSSYSHYAGPHKLMPLDPSRCVLRTKYQPRRRRLCERSSLGP